LQAALEIGGGFSQQRGGPWFGRAQGKPRQESPARNACWFLRRKALLKPPLQAGAEFVHDHRRQAWSGVLRLPAGGAFQDPADDPVAVLLLREAQRAQVVVQPRAGGDPLRFRIRRWKNMFSYDVTQHNCLFIPEWPAFAMPGSGRARTGEKGLQLIAEPLQKRSAEQCPAGRSWVFSKPAEQCSALLPVPGCELHREWNGALRNAHPAAMNPGNLQPQHSTPIPNCPERRRERGHSCPLWAVVGTRADKNARAPTSPTRWIFDG